MVTNSEFDQVVRATFAFIAANGAPRVVDAASQSESFGNNVMSLEGDALRVRVTLDRGQYLVDLSPLSPEWFDLDVVLQLVTGGENARETSANATLPLAQQAARVQRQLDAIVRAFRQDVWSATRTQLSALQQARGDAFRER